jgi:hypothetical protein
VDIHPAVYAVHRTTVVAQVTVAGCGVPEGSSASAEVPDGEIGVVEVVEAFGQKLRTS